MSDERTGRELAPRPDEGGGAITPREQPLPSTTPADRFSAGDQAHTVGLSEERAAQIVRSSSNARMAAFLAVLLVVLFIPIYWIYDIGLPFLGMGGRLEAQEQIQYVTDVARGHELYLNNCARCHGDQGEGGIGPPLNDQGKLYNSITAQGLPGPGHFNPTYLHAVLRDGGRIVCGNPDSFMPAWEQPLGPLNYREVEEIIAFMLAPNTVEWTYFDEHVTDPDETPHPPTREHGWRDPAYTPPPDATPVPACWAARPTTGPTPTAGPIESPGTPENPRVIEIHGTQDLRWLDAEGNQITQIPVVAGETLEFHIINDSAVVPHNFHIGTQAELAAAPMDTDLPGTGTFTSADGPQIFQFNTDSLPADNPQFACTVPGHYTPMHGDFVIVDGGSGNGGGNGASPSPTGSPAP
jgi:mono/diheme cytochrome c family protein